MLFGKILLSRGVLRSVARFSISTLPRSGNKGFRVKAKAALISFTKMSGVGIVLSVAYGSSQLKPLVAASPKPEERGLRDTLEVTDRLYGENKMKEALTYLERCSDSPEADILWRLARLCYKVGKYHVSDIEEQKALSERAVDYAERAVQADGQNFACHKWMGIIISWSSEFLGTRRKIERSFDIKNHFEQAIELNPKDPTSRHLLGQWCYSVASVPWYQKKIATVVFATPPYSTYDEALRHFQEAEKISPGFYSTNWLFIGKCFLQLGRVQEGGEWLKKVANFSSEVEEDLEAKQEATQLLKKLAIK